MNPLFGVDQGPPHFSAHAQYLPQHQNMSMAYGLGAYSPLAAYQQPMLGSFSQSSQETYPWMSNGANVVQGRRAGACPNLDPSMPANQLTNSTGGTGCEPGYNYFFPAEHTKIHVLKCPTKPWQLPDATNIPFHAAHVPVSTTCADLLKGFGATNETPKLNRCYEVVQGGNGRWYRGLSFGGENKEMMKKQIQDIGWDGTRTGQPGARPVVVLWITKDG